MDAWISLLNAGLVELISKDEEEYLNVVIYPSDLDSMSESVRLQYTHCEITPDMLQGAAAATSPKNNSNQAPRVIYQCNMAKQGIGIPGTNYNYIRRGKIHVLQYPQKPIVSTRISKKLGYDRLPMGQNATVGVIPWRGKNQEDSIIMNQDAIDRGFMCSYMYVSFDATLEHMNVTGNSKSEKFTIPNKDCNNFRGNPNKLQLFGENKEWCYVPKGVEVEKGDILIGMVVTYGKGDKHFNQSIYNKSKTDISVYYDHRWPAVVHSVQCGYSGEGYPYIRLVTRQYRKPVRGDKFCYTRDHQLLTTVGWVDVDKITLNHKVASLKDGKYLVYENPTEVMSFNLDEDEQLVKVETNQVDLCVTGNHNMYVQTRLDHEGNKPFKMMQAQELFDKHVHYKKDAEWVSDRYEYFLLPSCWRRIGGCKENYTLYSGRTIPLDAWCMFYGLWIAEGCVSEGKPVCVDVHKQRVLNALNISLEKMGFSYKIIGDYAQIYDPELKSYMRPLSVGAINKKLEDWVWDLSQEQARIVLEGMLLGDGHMNGNTPMYYTSSVQLKDDVMRLALHCGWAANAKMREEKGAHRIINGKNVVTNADAWVLTIVKTQLHPAVNKHIKNQQKWINSEDRDIFCCTVPNGLLYVRNKSDKFNLAVWSGNSSNHAQKGTIGEIYPSSQMPFFKRLGYAPNILINPLAFPSRMTIGMLIEIVMGTALTSSAMRMKKEYNYPLYPESSTEYEYPEGFTSDDYRDMNLTGDGTPFDKSFDVKYVMNCIEKMGLSGFCEDEAIIPETGEVLSTLIFHGVVYYQRLKHMPIDKIHARATGGTHCLTGQPTEGRRKKGAFRVGHMERDNLSGSSRINLPEGISISIRDMSKIEENVWGMDVQKEGLVMSKQVDFGSRKNRPKYVMTLQDGRTIEGSNNHPFYTQEEEYSDMKDLVVGKDRLACSLEYPLVSFEEDMKLCEGWIWDADFFDKLYEWGPDEIQTPFLVYRKSLCLARILGLVVSDGFVSDTDYRVYVFPDHQLDVDSVTRDINKVSGLYPLPTTRPMKKYALILPVELCEVIRKMGVIVGERTYQEASFPDFINEDTPLPILREFLGAMFGGDGHTCVLYRHHPNKPYDLKEVGFSWVRCEDMCDSLTETMYQLQELLSRFGIVSTIQNPKDVSSSDNFEVALVISIDSLVTFSETIGFRYCVNKAIKLSAGVSYRRFRENLELQRMKICDRIDELLNYRKRYKAGEDGIVIPKALKQASQEFRDKEIVLHERAFPTGSRMVARILQGKNKPTMKGDLPFAEEWMVDIGAIHLFKDYENPDRVVNSVPYDSNVIPVFYLKVIDIKNTGEFEDMYDITIEGTESYLANGIVAHNCILAQGTPEMAQDRLFYQSDPCKIPVCQACGLQAIDNGTRAYCTLCQTSNIVSVRLPFGTKLLQQELAPMNIVPRIITLPARDDKINVIGL